jgi:hypothetical protein
MAKEDIPEFEESEYEGILAGVIYKKDNAVVIGMKQLESKAGKLNQFIDIRTYYYVPAEEKWTHTSRGVTLPVAELPEFREILERLEGLIE